MRILSPEHVRKYANVWGLGGRVDALFHLRQKDEHFKFESVAFRKMLR